MIVCYRDFSMSKLALHVSEGGNNVRSLRKKPCLRERLNAPIKLFPVAILQSKLIVNLRQVLRGEKRRQSTTIARTANLELAD